MILIENMRIDGIPSLHLAQKDSYHDPLPLVIFEHGFTSAKEHNLHYAYLLAEKAYVWSCRKQPFMENGVQT